MWYNVTVFCPNRVPHFQILTWINISIDRIYTHWKWRRRRFQLAPLSSHYVPSYLCSPMRTLNSFQLVIWMKLYSRKRTGLDSCSKCQLIQISFHSIQFHSSPYCKTRNFCDTCRQNMDGVKYDYVISTRYIVLHSSIESTVRQCNPFRYDVVVLVENSVSRRKVRIYWYSCRVNVHLQVYEAFRRPTEHRAYGELLRSVPSAHRYPK